MLLLPTICDERHSVFRSSLWPSVCTSVNGYFMWHDNCLVSGWISLKFATNKLIRQSFSRSEVNGTARPNALFQLRHRLDDLAWRLTGMPFTVIVLVNIKIKTYKFNFSCGRELVYCLRAYLI